MDGTSYDDLEFLEGIVEAEEKNFIDARFRPAVAQGSWRNATRNVDAVERRRMKPDDVDLDLMKDPCKLDDTDLMFEPQPEPHTRDSDDTSLGDRLTSDLLTSPRMTGRNTGRMTGERMTGRNTGRMTCPAGGGLGDRLSTARAKPRLTDIDNGQVIGVGSESGSNDAMSMRQVAQKLSCVLTQKSPDVLDPFCELPMVGEEPLRFGSKSACSSELHGSGERLADCQVTAQPDVVNPNGSKATEHPFEDTSCQRIQQPMDTTDRTQEMHWRAAAERSEVVERAALARAEAAEQRIEAAEARAAEAERRFAELEATLGASSRASTMDIKPPDIPRSKSQIMPLRQRFSLKKQASPQDMSAGIGEDISPSSCGGHIIGTREGVEASVAGSGVRAAIHLSEASSSETTSPKHI